jgi:hypothetical protein
MECQSELSGRDRFRLKPRTFLSPRERSLFRASLFRTINDLQIHVRPLNACKDVDDTSNADLNCGLVTAIVRESGGKPTMLRP